MAAVLDHHDPDVMLPCLMVWPFYSGGIENFKMFDLVDAIDRRRTGQDHHIFLTVVNRISSAKPLRNGGTGYSSAYAVILFVTVFGLASIIEGAEQGETEMSFSRHRNRPAAEIGSPAFW